MKDASRSETKVAMVLSCLSSRAKMALISFDSGAFALGEVNVAVRGTPRAKIVLLRRRATWR
eukprot:8823072-Prorocentrum_lima.AAC.1